MLFPAELSNGPGGFLPGSVRTDFGPHRAVIIPVIWKLGLKRLEVNERHCLPCNASFSSPTSLKVPLREGQEATSICTQGLRKPSWGFEEEACSGAPGKWRELGQPAGHDLELQTESLRPG